MGKSVKQCPGNRDMIYQKHTIPISTPIAQLRISIFIDIYVFRGGIKTLVIYDACHALMHAHAIRLTFDLHVSDLFNMSQVRCRNTCVIRRLVYIGEHEDVFPNRYQILRGEFL